MRRAVGNVLACNVLARDVLTRDVLACDVLTGDVLACNVLTGDVRRATCTPRVGADGPPVHSLPSSSP